MKPRPTTDNLCRGCGGGQHGGRDGGAGHLPAHREREEAGSVFLQYLITFSKHLVGFGNEISMEKGKMGGAKYSSNSSFLVNNCF